MTPLLEVSGLAVRFPLRRGFAGAVARRPVRQVRAVDGVSFSIGKGELVALVGESGCGKTTTARAVLRLERTSAGAILFDGEDITAAGAARLRRLRRRMQIVYQDPYESLDPRFRVRDTIEEPLLIHGIGHDRAVRRGLVHDALSRVGLDPPEMYADRYPHELSGGQRQRVAIAAALVLGPSLLVADEPVSMLDVSVRAGVLTLLDELRRSSGTAILMITHDLSTAARFADRIAVMYLGRIVEHGPARSIIDDPRHPYTKALLSAVPDADPRRARRAAAARRVLAGEPRDPASVPPGCRFHPRCPVAEDRCSSLDPALVTLGGEHEAACILEERPRDAPGAGQRVENA